MSGALLVIRRLTSDREAFEEIFYSFAAAVSSSVFTVLSVAISGNGGINTAVISHLTKARVKSEPVYQWLLILHNRR